MSEDDCDYLYEEADRFWQEFSDLCLEFCRRARARGGSELEAQLMGRMQDKASVYGARDTER